MIDDIGLLPISADAAEGLYRLVDAAYEKRSLALSTNIHPSGFDQLMDKTIASALVDRLLHHAHVVLTLIDQGAGCDSEAFGLPAAEKPSRRLEPTFFALDERQVHVRV